MRNPQFYVFGKMPMELQLKMYKFGDSERSLVALIAAVFGRKPVAFRLQHV